MSDLISSIQDAEECCQKMMDIEAERIEGQITKSQLWFELRSLKIQLVIAKNHALHAKRLNPR